MAGARSPRRSRACPACNRVNDPIYAAGRFSWNFPLDVDLIERIEFIPGPGVAVYGQNAMFGVVNVITRTGAGMSGVELAADYQDLQRQSFDDWNKSAHYPSPGIHDVPASGIPAMAAASTVSATRSSFSR